MEHSAPVQTPRPLARPVRRKGIWGKVPEAMSAESGCRSLDSSVLTQRDYRWEAYSLLRIPGCRVTKTSRLSGAPIHNNQSGESSFGSEAAVSGPMTRLLRSEALWLPLS